MGGPGPPWLRLWGIVFMAGMQHIIGRESRVLKFVKFFNAPYIAKKQQPSTYCQTSPAPLRSSYHKRAIEIEQFPINIKCRNAFGNIDESQFLAIVHCDICFYN